MFPVCCPYWVLGTWFVLPCEETCHKLVDSPTSFLLDCFVLPALHPVDQVQHGLVPLAGHLLLPHHPLVQSVQLDLEVLAFGWDLTSWNFTYYCNISEQSKTSFRAIVVHQCSPAEPFAILSHGRSFFTISCNSSTAQHFCGKIIFCLAVFKIFSLSVFKIVSHGHLAQPFHHFLQLLIKLCLIDFIHFQFVCLRFRFIFSILFLCNYILLFQIQSKEDDLFSTTSDFLIG